MTTTEEQKPKDMYNQMAQLSSSLPNKRYPILCKFWMMGNCLKDEKCEYLHSEREKRGLSYIRSKIDGDTECPMYSLGFCRNGSMCNYKHTERKLEQSELDNMPELPIWYLEYVMEKPISLIFEDFEEQNKEEVESLMKKFRNTKQTNKYIKHSISKSLQNQNYPNNLPHMKYHHLTGHMQHQPYDIYGEKKDFIIRSLAKKVRYFLIRNTNMSYVKLAMEYNCLLNIKQNSIKLKEAQKSCDEVILIMFDEQNMNFNGFCKFKKELSEKDVEYIGIINNPIISDFKINQNTSYLKIEWHWKTKLSFDKVELIKNPLNNDEPLIECKDCQEISMDVGNYICRLMIKRLSKNEVKEYLEKRKLTDDINMSKNYDIDIKNSTVTSSDINNINLNNLILGEISKKNLNQSLVFQTSSSNNCNTSDNISNNISNNNIIVTNISNLQVNISQNSYQSKNLGKSFNKEKLNKKRNRSRSKSRDLLYSKVKKERKRSRSKSYRRREKKNKYKRKYSNENEKGYESDETVVLKDEVGGDSQNSPVKTSSRKSDDVVKEIIHNDKKIINDKNKPEVNSDVVNFSRDRPSKRNDNKIMNNTLFSNAMRKIALQSVKPK
jgi:hypothetical protein